ncbi:MAG: hypothetical protein U9R39_07785 [Campylobacterota bacterium]|nr:hypothetical protein [Campylobacterota bacterium]
MVVNDFKIIIKAKKVPVNIDNEIINYVQDSTLKNNHLHCEIYFQETLIAQGIILDFYKEFEILEGFNKVPFTHILTFEYNGREHQSYTRFGNIIYKIKYLTNKPITEEIRELYLNEIISYFNGYINYLKENYTNLNITYIPSQSKVPDEISSKLSKINTIPLKANISKNSSVSSKSITNLSTQEFNKYFVDLSQSNTNDNFILIDDVMGTSASLCETMYKLYDFNKKVNFFFIPVTDVKR